MTRSPVLITGASGQLGKDLIKSAPSKTQLLCPSSSSLDISSQESVEHYCEQHRPQHIINCAAYTAVDKAETDQATAYSINQTGVENLCLAAKKINAKLTQISTDFVFDGKQGQPYSANDETGPLGIYGASKLAGEQAVTQHLADDGTIFRTSWLYSSHGNNFVKTMLHLFSIKDELNIIADQIGTPTWTLGLAQAIWGSLDKPISGIQQWSDAGVASWYDFAVAIKEEAFALGLVDKTIAINPIATSQYPTPARRPNYSVMDKQPTWHQLDMQAPHWRVNLRLMLKELIEESL